jgi:hypothetical protein
MGLFLARSISTAVETITLGLIFAAPFLLLGWFSHRWRYRRETTGPGGIAEIDRAAADARVEMKAGRRKKKKG